MRYPGAPARGETDDALAQIASSITEADEE
jgi:hypothetical protein